jgi:hypothetical protein
MSWELGAAAALGKEPLFVARVLGLRPEALPLNLRSHYAPDLGQEEEALEFIDRLFRRLSVDSESFESSFRLEYNRSAANGQPSPFRAVSTERGLKVTSTGPYLLIENELATELTDFELIMGQNLPPALTTAVKELKGHGRLLPGERLAIPTAAAPASLPDDSPVIIEWNEALHGRQWQRVVVEHKDFEFGVDAVSDN